MAINYCLGSGELDSITKAYDEQSIGPAYGLTLIVLCYENASAVFGDSTELHGLNLWIEDFAQAADEGLDYIDRYNDSLKAAHASAETDTGGDAERIDLAQLNEWMEEVVKSLDYCLNRGLGVKSRDLSEEERRIDAYIESIMTSVRDVVHDARDLLLKKKSHAEKLDKPNSVDVASMFGEADWTITAS